MNLSPPPSGVDTDEMLLWMKEVWEFLQNPVFQSVRFSPRTNSPDDEKGRMYYDSDTDLFYGYTGSWDEFGDIT
jgi:hypothetical protein